ncbi:AraC family transcriptional regulator [Actinomadura craniellae]|uniref:AraC family transcriptional regulator n=1 Tax=Actinomadura craniellae TaxID=2231787 RepID=A0A365H3L8_9ACTN|nr:helix-turn-helix transcriptional regulator [Actinomadura craniellae]RAY13697.1 AraC family transcriptional regulator [Actinomadura craniellae]
MTDSFLPSPANLGLVVLRTRASVGAGTMPYDAEHLVTGWHHHDLHQIEYALEGMAEVETAAGRYLVPPQQAIWVPAGLAHNTTLRSARSASVFFDPSMFPAHLCDRARVLAAVPLLREMIVYALRWPITRDATDARADTYFSALALVVEDNLDREQPLWLPTSTDPLVAAVISYTEEHLATVTADDVCGALGISERTLRRRFREETGTTWRTFAAQARLIRAMALLTQPGTTVLGVAAAVGFGSPSAFNRAFRACTGSTPADYRRRVTGRTAAPLG